MQTEIWTEHETGIFLKRRYGKEDVINCCCSPGGVHVVEASAADG